MVPQQTDWAGSASTRRWRARYWRSAWTTNSRRSCPGDARGSWSWKCATQP